MSRNGKIARLPRKIRDELNRRLDDAEQGARLVEWLNSLPEVKQILDTDFEGRAINEVNLTEWKQGGFLDWQVQQETMAGLVNVKADGQELAGAGGSVTDDLEAIVMARYATTLYSSNGEMSAEVQARLQSLASPCATSCGIVAASNPVTERRFCASRWKLNARRPRRVSVRNFWNWPRTGKFTSD
jgi:hypothetical protein